MTAQTPDWRDETNPAVLVVDVSQKRADPNLETSYPDVVESVEQIRRLLDVARDEDVPVFFSRGGRSYYTSGGAALTDVERGAWTKLFPVRDETGQQAEYAYAIAPALAPQPDEVVITKSGPSAFFKSMLPVYLSNLQVDTLIVTGMTTSGCVRATVVDAFSHGLHVVLPVECTADPRSQAHDFHLGEIDRKYGHVASLDDVVEYVHSVGDGTYDR